MSTFTRTTTPPFSANPLQAFVTYKQARRAAKGASPIAFLMAALTAISLALMMGSDQFVQLPQNAKIAALVIIGAMVTGLLCLGWRLWVRPGPWKILPVLVFVLLEVAAEAIRLTLINLIVVGVALNFTVIAYRGALAMKRLKESVPEIDVF
jgi:hypothetical protein